MGHEAKLIVRKRKPINFTLDDLNDDEDKDENWTSSPKSKSKSRKFGKSRSEKTSKPTSTSGTEDGDENWTGSSMAIKSGKSQGGTTIPTSGSGTKASGKGFPCSYCKKKFSQKNDLRGHMKQKHKEQLLRWYTNAKKVSDDQKPCEENNKVDESSKDLKVSDEKKITGNKRIWPCGKCEKCLLDDCGDCIPCVNKKKNGGTGKLKQKCVEKSCPIQEKLKQELRASKSNITNKPVHDPNTKKAQGTSKAPKTKSEKQMGKSETLLGKAASKEFQCPYCNGKFTGKFGKSSLKMHVKLKHEEQFEITDFSLISDNQKTSNENDAEVDKPSKAPKTKSEKQMGKPESLLGKAASKEFQCPYCNSKFAGKYGKSSLKKHVKLRHEEQFEITDFSLISGNQKSSNENDAKVDKPSRDLTEFDKFIQKRKSTESLGNPKKTPRISEAKKSKSKKQIEPSDDPLDLLDDLEKDEVGPDEDEVTLLSTGSGNKIEKPAVALIQVFGEDDL